MRYLIPIICVIMALTSCKDAANTSKSPQTPPITQEVTLPPIPNEELAMLFQECDFVDYIFYELPFSMSYDQKSTIQTALKWVSQEVPANNPSCKPLGRMIFQKAGNTLIEAELFVNADCAHYLWIKDGKKAYVNKMTQNGLNHYLGIINQFKK